MHENKTVEEIYNILINGFESEFNQKFRLLPKSFIRVWSKIVAGVFITGYRTNAWWGLQQFPLTAYYGNVSCLGMKINPLKMLGKLYGVGEPYLPTKWSGKITVHVTTKGVFLDAGTQLKSSVNGLLYLTTETARLTGDTAEVAVECAVGGTAGNLDDGDMLDFVNPLSCVAKSAEVSYVEKDGTDEESEESYRNRVNIRFSTKPHGGSYADFREWATDVPGVKQTYIYGDEEDISGDKYLYAGVIIFVAADPALYSDRIPDNALLRAVGESCTYDPDTGQMRKMIGQVIDPEADGSYSNVRPVSVTAFDVSVTGLSDIDVADFKGAAKSALKTYFEGREPYIRGLSNESEVLNKVSYNNVLGVLNEVAISLKCDFDKAALDLDGIEIMSYTLGYGELAKLGNLYIDGIKV